MAKDTGTMRAIGLAMVAVVATPGAVLFVVAWRAGLADMETGCRGADRIGDRF
jgi:hypothetical protein